VKSKGIRVEQRNKGNVYNIPTCKNEKARVKTYQFISTASRRKIKKLKNAKKNVVKPFRTLGDQLTESDPSNI
jgi:hypothetical protein